MAQAPTDEALTEGQPHNPANPDASEPATVRPAEDDAAEDDLTGIDDVLDRLDAGIKREHAAMDALLRRLRDRVTP
jgi:hypothetical protein